MGRFFQPTACHHLGLLGSLCLLGFTSPAFGQLVPDATLPNNTVVIPNGNISVIEQGTRVGGNLFHSFSEFSVPTGDVAFFNNAPDIENIINRVTGGNLSNIDGVLAANGTANLFLINPNGIIFGANAQLNIGGSFISSTANSIKFADGSEFSATNPGAPPLLTINVPIGLQFGSNPKSIINQSQATSPVPLPPLDPSIPIPTNVGLQVLPGQTLALIGGDLILNSGNLTAFQGEIHLVSVASRGLVRFIPTPTGLALDNTGIQNFGNIELSGTASVNASGLGGGAIQVTGGRVWLRDASNLISDTVGSFDGRGIAIQAVQFSLQDLAFVSAGSTFGTGAGGDLAIRADSVELRGTGFERFRQIAIEEPLVGTPNPLVRESGLLAGTVGAGKAGNIRIDTRQLTLRDGGVIASPTFSNQGAGGNITISASELVEVTGSGVLTTAFNTGDAGTLQIDTGKLIVRDGAVVSTATLGAGNGGDLIVRASESVVVSGDRADSPLATNLSATSIGSTGKAGNLEINTRSVLVEGGATITSASGIFARDRSGILARNRLIPSDGRGGNLSITASDSITVIGTSADGFYRSLVVTATLGSANAGDLRINTKRLIIQDGAGIGGSTVGTGRGGDIFVDASDSVEVSGTTRDGVSPSGVATASGDLLTASLFPDRINPTGAAGDIRVTTGRLIVRDGARVSVESVGSGDAGSINVVADAIALDNKGSISATNIGSGAGGNINLQARDMRLDNGSSIDAKTGSGAEGNTNLQAQDIQLRSGSQISTNADNSRGGNIAINTDTLVAVPSENSDITANAREGPGGQVRITAQGIFGTQFQEKPTPESDITATSERSPEFNGIVDIDIRGIDPSQGLVELPETVIESNQQIATGCATDEGSSFTLTGRGGLPEDPTSTLRGRAVWRDLRDLSSRDRGLQVSRLQVERSNQSSNLQPTNLQPSTLVEATGWVMKANGEVELVARTPEVTPQSPSPTPANCGDWEK